MNMKKMYKKIFSKKKESSFEDTWCDGMDIGSFIYIVFCIITFLGGAGGLIIFVLLGAFNLYDAVFVIRSLYTSIGLLAIGFASFVLGDALYII